MRDIFDEMSRMQEEMDRMFNDFFRIRRPALAGPKGSEKAVTKVSPFRTPVCNLQETERAVIATFEIPGAEKGDIDLKVTDYSIEVKAQQKIEKKTEDKGYYSYVSSASQFYRRMPLPAKVDEKNAVAIYKDGVLRVTMPKVQARSESKGTRINVR